MSEEITVEQLDGLVQEYRAIQECIEEKELELKPMREEKEKIAAKLMGILKTLKKKNYKCEAGTFSIVEKTRVSLPQTDEDKEALFNWLKERGLYHAYATVNSNSINALYNAEFEQVKKTNDPELIMDFKIPGLGEPKVHEIVSFRRSGEKTND